MKHFTLYNWQTGETRTLVARCEKQAIGDAIEYHKADPAVHSLAIFIEPGHSLNKIVWGVFRGQQL